MPGNSGPPGWWVAGLVLIIVLAVGGFIMRTAVLRQGGLNPFVDKEQLEVKIAKGLDRLDTPPPAGKSIEERLAQIEDLYERGIISREELKDARAKVIADS